MAELFKMKLLDVNKNQILPETSADQVTMAGGGNVEAKIKSLESAFAAGTRLLGTVGTEVLLLNSSTKNTFSLLCDLDKNPRFLRLLAKLAEKYFIS